MDTVLKHCRWRARTCALVLGLVAVFTCNSAFAQQGTWTTKASMLGPQTTGGAGAINGLFYVAEGGTGQNCSAGGGPPATTALEAYNPLTNMWSAKTPAFLPRTGVGSAVVGGKLYVVGGNINGDGNAVTTELEVYDSISGMWSFQSPIPKQRQDPQVGAIGTKIYVAGGEANCGGCVPTSDLQIYDTLTNTWTAGPSMPFTQDRGAAGVVNGILYVVGGGTGSGNVGSSFTGLVQAFDPSANGGLGAWSTKASMPTPRHDLAIGVLNGRLYAVGGDDSSGTNLQTMESYDPTTDSWTLQPPMPTARHGLQVGVVSGTLYAAGGAANTCPFLTTNEAFTPANENNEDVGEGEDNEGDDMEFDDNQNDPSHSNFQFNDPSKSLSVWSVGGVSGIGYNGSCVSFMGNAVVNAKSGYVFAFSACNLSVAGTGIGAFNVTVTGPGGFFYTKRPALTAGYVKIHPH